MFNGLLSTHLGPVEDDNSKHFLRPETAQGIFVNYHNVARRRARSRRSESLKRARVSETRSLPATSSSARGSLSRWRWSSSLSLVRTRVARLLADPALGLVRRSRTSIPIICAYLSTHRRSCRTTPSEQSTSSTDSSLVAPSSVSLRASRTGRTLTCQTHSKHSGTDLSYFDQEAGERWTPYVIEPAAGLTRAVLAFLLNAYDEDEAPNTKGGVDKRTVLRFDPRSGASQGGRPAAVATPNCLRKPSDLAALFASDGTWTSTMPARSVADTAARRNRNPLLHHGGFRLPRRRRRHDPRARFHGSGTNRARFGRRVAARAATSLLTDRV